MDQEIANDPTLAGPAATAADCLAKGSGDSAAKARLLTALCRNRGIPARLVTGLPLTRGNEQTAHVWVEAWLNDHWLPICPFYHHFGRVPRTYLVFGFGDMPLVRGRNVRNLNYAFLVESPASPKTPRRPSLDPPAVDAVVVPCCRPPEQRLVEFLLLLPVAALIICVFRNVIGLHSFGTFAPALIGLAFRDLRQPARHPRLRRRIVLIGWLMRRLLDRYHLLQVPRIALMLSLVVLVLIVGHRRRQLPRKLPATRYISLFPMVILTGMIERFWTLETEDGTTSLVQARCWSTMLIAATISLVLSLHGAGRPPVPLPRDAGPGHRWPHRHC